MAQRLENPFYYLENFEFVLNWVEQRYADVLHSSESGFIQQFYTLPQAARALLVRMVMRKGTLFRHSRLCYTEIGDTSQALAPLIQAGWVNAQPLLNLQQVFGLFTKADILRAFSGLELSPSLSKAALLEQMWRKHVPETIEPIGAVAGSAKLLSDASSLVPGMQQPLQQWWPGANDTVYELLIMPLCERFRLMFFGNLRQDWSEFVLADLGLYRYETVVLSPSCRALACRQDIDDYLHLHACAQGLHEGESPQAVLAGVPALPYSNPWIERRRAKLLFKLGQACERAGQWQDALAAYGASDHPEAGVRRIRVLERTERFDEALQSLNELLVVPANDAQTQQLTRMQPRLQRKLGRPVARPVRQQEPQSLYIHLCPASMPAPAPDDTAHPYPGAAASIQPDRSRTASAIYEIAATSMQETCRVEELARRHLHQDDAPVHYVENSLLNALFGLLCWDAIFAPVPGAFFHPFQRGPADLHDPGFYARRQALFEACLTQLDSGRYLHTIQANFAAKAGLQCSFVHWPAISTELLQLTLQCIPADHLKKCFMRLLSDIPGNRAGLPDLIQFQPAEQSYRLIEVKGPGDRVQDNQRRWLNFFTTHNMPVMVCFVRWAQQP